MAETSLPLINYYPTPYASGYDFNPYTFPPPMAMPGQFFTFCSMNQDTHLFWTFDAGGNPISLFSQSAPPYMAEPGGTQYSIDSKIGAGMYYLSSTQNFEHMKGCNVGKGMNGTLNVGSRM